MKHLGEPCVLKDRPCIECGECDRCDLDPNKVCDNCCQCIKLPEGDYAEIGIDDILVNTEDQFSNTPKHSTHYKIKSRSRHDRKI